LLRVIVSVDLVFSPTLAGDKAWTIVGAIGGVAVNVAAAAALLPPAGPVDSACAAMVFV
jgi:hypothetical protein